MHQQTGAFEFAIPEEAITPGRELVVVFRFRFPTNGARGRGTASPIDKNTKVILGGAESAAHEVNYLDSHLSVWNFVSSALGFLVGLVVLALYFALPSRREYLAASIVALSTGVFNAMFIWGTYSAYTTPMDLFGFFLGGVEQVASVELVRLIVNQPQRRWLLICEIVVGITPLTLGLANTGVGSYYLAFALSFAPWLLAYTLMNALLIRAAIRGNTEARILLPAIAWQSFFTYYYICKQVLFFTHLTPQLLPSLAVKVGSYTYFLSYAGVHIFDLALLLFLVVRTVGITRERQRIAGELEAARATQQLLLSRAAQSTPGFHIESIYYPASEVGGDFYLVTPGPSGSIMAIIGDVSGKGLTAAMRVAMILGILRREDSWEPAEVLAHLNQALCNPGDSGFTTACCLRLEADGHYRVANAGHLAPYVSGSEVITGAALPLGLSAGEQYTETTGDLSADDLLVLLTDGVVEARNERGELFGFERTRIHSIESAQGIADLARQFGQEDDITVLKVTLAAT